MSIDVEFIVHNDRLRQSMFANTPPGRRWMAGMFPKNPYPSINFVLPWEIRTLVSKAEADGLIVQVWSESHHRAIGN